MASDAFQTAFLGRTCDFHAAGFRVDFWYGLSYTINVSTGPEGKTLVLIGGEIRTPPMSVGARREVGRLLRRLQGGESLGMPHSRPMPSIGRGVHELRVRDADHNWRLIYRTDERIVLVVEIFEKKTPATPGPVIDLCRKRLRDWDS
jgi:phage-related protein